MPQPYYRFSTQYSIYQNQFLRYNNQLQHLNGRTRVACIAPLTTLQAKYKGHPLAMKLWSPHWSIQKHHMNLTIKQQQPTNHGSTLRTYPLVKQKCLIVHSWRQPHREYIETPKWIMQKFAMSLAWNLH
jgi:hypothetical protein